MSAGDDRSRTSGARRGPVLALLLLSTVTVATQIVQVRVFSYTMNHAFVYMAISLAMLGFGLSGTLLALVPRLRRLGPERGLSVALIGFGVTLLAANAVFARTSHRAVPEQGLSVFSPVAALLLVFTVPYLFAGGGTALALLADARGFGRRYAINLAGAGLGCFLVYPALDRLGAEHVIVITAGLTVLGATLTVGRKARGPVAVAAALVFVLVAGAERVLPFRPDAADQLSELRRHVEAETPGGGDFERVYSAWDPVGKVEIYRLPGRYELFGGRARTLFFTQDAGAGSILFSVKDHPALREALVRGTLYGLASRLRPGGDVLVVGLGGGPDLFAALDSGAAHVTGAEINAAAMEALAGPLRDFAGLPAPGSARFDLVHADGRGYVRRFENHFDVIQMTGADTYAANPSCGSMLSENFLYTVEAFRDDLRALQSDGLLAITRFGLESVRVFNTMLTALEESGVAEPRRHLAVVAQGPDHHWSCVLTKKTPFTAEECARLEELCRESVELAPRLSLPAYRVIGFSFETPMRVLYHPQMAVDFDKVRAANLYPDLDLGPVRDDRPFFFQFRRLDDIGWSDVFDRGAVDRHHWGVTDYVVVVAQLAAVALLLIVAPLLALRGAGMAPARAVRHGVFFFATGAGFMLVEIVLMQSCALFLGHPNHAISTVLFALLVFSGLGSLLASWLPVGGSRIIVFAVAGIIAWLALFASLSSEMFESHLAGSTLSRALWLVAVLAPLGLLLGMPFPTAMRAVEACAPRFAPWAWGTNGFASVLASLAAIPLSMRLGFTATLATALACYAVAGLAAVGGGAVGRQPESS